MKLLSLCETTASAQSFKFDDIRMYGMLMPNQNTVYTAFFESPDTDDEFKTVLEAILIVDGLSHMQFEIESVPHFDSYDEAHKYAFIRSFGEEAYETSLYAKQVNK